MKLEQRFFAADVKIEERAATGSASQPLIRGYAAVFNQLSQVMWGFREQIAPGAFAACMEDDVRALWNHNTDYVLGRTKSGTLRLAEDNTGLMCEVAPADTQLTRDFMGMIQRGDVDQMSFGFVTLEDEWDMDDQDQVIRTIRKVKLYEVSPVTFPAYTQTSVAVRGQAVDGLYVPEIPATCRRALDVAAGAGETRARLAALRRRWELVSRQ